MTEKEYTKEYEGESSVESSFEYDGSIIFPILFLTVLVGIGILVFRVVNPTPEERETEEEGDTDE